VQIGADKLVEAALAKADGPTNLARHLQLAGYSSPKRVARWRDGVAKPDYESTIALLQFVGWLDEDAIRHAFKTV
jgi:hypothetical protein